MAGDNAADVRQTDSRAFKLLGTVQTLENAEKFLGVLHLETHAIVAHENHDLLLLVETAHFDDRGVFWSGILHRIRKQIDEYLPEHRVVAEDRGESFNFPLDHPILGFLPL